MTANHIPILEFAIGTARYGVPISQVSEVVDLVACGDGDDASGPHDPPDRIEYRGAQVEVVDPTRLLDEQPSDVDSVKDLGIVIETEDGEVQQRAWAIDEVIEVNRIPEVDIDDSEDGIVAGEIDCGNHTVTLLVPSALPVA